MSYMNLVFVKKARKNVYAKGVCVPAENKKGWRIDREKPNEEGDELIIARGDSYWHWKFRNDPYVKFYSKSKPEFWQLLSSPVLRSLAESCYKPVDRSKFTPETLYLYYLTTMQTAYSETTKSLCNIRQHLHGKVNSWHILNERISVINKMIDEILPQVAETLKTKDIELIADTYRTLSEPFISSLIKNEQ